MKKKKLWLRILAALLAFGLLFIAIWMTLSFTGDPISASLARRAAQEYIRQNDLYSMGFELSDASYNFKFGEYLIHAKSARNPDLHFDINWRNGKVFYDTYQYDVLENGNVITRFQEEYEALLQIQLEQAGLGRENLFVSVDEPQDSDIWVTGMAFDQALPVKKDLQLYPDLEEATLEAAADYLRGVYSLLKEKGHAFETVGLYYNDGDKHTVMLDGIPVKRVEQADFLAYLKEMQRDTEKRDATEKEAMDKGVPTEPVLVDENGERLPMVFVD
ncbi:MAG: hypothetical protein PHE47_00745 [Oscillospiraceae bacterium]|nr:hypothetical protein [Oscillospiraceae bacterium]